MTALSETKRYQAYPEYKESEVQWLESLPSHWLEGRIKHISTNLDFRRIPLSAEERGNRQGEYPYYGASGVIDRVDEYLFDEDTILFGEDGANLLAKSTPLAFIASGKYWVNNHAHILKPLDEMYSFWVNSLNNLDISPAVSGSAQPKLTAEALGNLEIVYPPSTKERQTIANFLDHETAKIDTLIEKQQQLIKLLKEKRQAVISHAVTKGISYEGQAQAPKKDSGVEWLGEVPEHWDVSRVGWLCDYLSYGFTNPMPATDCGPYMLTAADIEYGQINLSNARKTSVDAYKKLLSAKSKPEKGDVLITKDGTLGRVALFDSDEVICISQSIALLRVNKNKVLPEFFSLALLGSDYQSKMIFDAGGTTIKHIYISILAKMNFLLPNLEEQREIVRVTNDKLKKTDLLIQQANQASALLQERRTALISAAVTGKIDVRNFKPKETKEVN